MTQNVELFSGGLQHVWSNWVRGHWVRMCNRLIFVCACVCRLAPAGCGTFATEWRSDGGGPRTFCCAQRRQLQPTGHRLRQRGTYNIHNMWYMYTVDVSHLVILLMCLSDIKLFCCAKVMELMMMLFWPWELAVTVVKNSNKPQMCFRVLMICLYINGVYRALNN